MNKKELEILQQIKNNERNINNKASQLRKQAQEIINETLENKDLIEQLQGKTEDEKDHVQNRTRYFLEYYNLLPAQDITDQYVSILEGESLNLSTEELERVYKAINGQKAAVKNMQGYIRTSVRHATEEKTNGPSRFEARKKQGAKNEQRKKRGVAGPAVHGQVGDPSIKPEAPAGLEW